jgi:DNA-binding MarR family transcriptional regulator
VDKKISTSVLNDAQANNDDAEIDFDVLPTLLGYHLRRAQITVFNDFVKTMSEVQITPGQFGVALLICSNPGLTQSALARAVGIERSTMVAVIDALESRGLVERRPSPLDRRSYALVLSDQGNALIEKLRPMVSSHEDRIAANLSDEERAQLIALLSKVADD